MASSPVYDIGGSSAIWAGFPAERALAWTRVLNARRPSWPGAGPMWMLSKAYEQGRPAGLATWAHRARRAEAIGLGPDRYLALHESLDRVPAAEFASHPDNDLDPARPTHPTRAFDAVLWSPWAALIDEGMTPEQATRLLLTARDAGMSAAEG